MDHEPSNDETIAGPPVGANPHAQESRVDVLGLTGRVLEDRYEIEELIGAGGDGICLSRAATPSAPRSGD